MSANIFLLAAIGFILMIIAFPFAERIRRSDAMEQADMKKYSIEIQRISPQQLADFPRGFIYSPGYAWYRIRVTNNASNAVYIGTRRDKSPHSVHTHILSVLEHDRVSRLTQSNSINAPKWDYTRPTINLNNPGIELPQDPPGEKRAPAFANNQKRRGPAPMQTSAAACSSQRLVYRRGDRDPEVNV